MLESASPAPDMPRPPLSRLLLTAALLALGAPAFADTFVLVIWDELSASEVERLRAKHPGALPALDSLQSKGTTFTRFYSQPWCKPTRLALHTGRWSGVLQGRGCAESGPYIPRGQPMLGKTFDAAGYATALFGKWQLGSNPLVATSPKPVGHFVTTPAMFRS